MSEPVFTGGGGQAPGGLFTWGGDGPRRICDLNGLPAPEGSYGAAVAAGYFMVRDDRHGTWQWVRMGEMVRWDGTPNPVREALQKAKAALMEAAAAAGVGI